MNFAQTLNFSSDGYDWDGNEFANLFNNQHTITLIEPGTMTVSGAGSDNMQSVILDSGDVVSFLLDFSLTSGLQLRVSNPGLGNVDVSASYEFEYDITDNGGSYSVDTVSLNHNSDQPPTITAGMLDYDSMSLDLMITPEDMAALGNVQVNIAGGTLMSLSDMILASDTAGSGYFELISVDRDGNITVSDALILDGEDQYQVSGLLPGDGLTTMGQSIDPFQDWPDDDYDVLYDVSYSNTLMMASFWGLVNGTLDFYTGDDPVYLGSDANNSYFGGVAAVFLPEITSQIELTQEFIFDPEDVFYTASVDGVVIGSGKLGQDFEFTIPESFDGFDYDIDWDFKLGANMQAFGSASHSGEISISGVGAAIAASTGLFGNVEMSAGSSLFSAVTNGSNFTIDPLYDSGIVDVSDAFTLNMTTSLQLRTYDFTIEGASFADLIVQDPVNALTGAELIDNWLQDGLGYVGGVTVSDVFFVGTPEAAFQLDTFSIYKKYSDDYGLLFSTGGLPDNLNDETDESLEHGTDGHDTITNLLTDLSAAKNLTSSVPDNMDASGMEFTLNIDNTDIKSIRFEFAFGSEEFPEFVDTNFTDFAAIVINDENYALLDGDADKPLGAFTKTLESGYYVDNSQGQWAIEWDGFTEYLTVTAPVRQGANKIEIVVADTGDAIYDSGLYIGDIELITDDGYATSILKIGEFEYGDDIYATIAKEELNLPEGSNMVVGTLDTLNGDILTGFETGDSVLILGQDITADDLTVSEDGTRLEIDVNQDGTTDSILNFRGDFTSASFVTSQHDDGTLVTAIFESKIITGNSGNGVSTGGGNDNIFDALGNDQFKGAGGDDTLVSLSGSNAFNGDDGSDFIVSGMHGDVMLGGADHDILRGDASRYFGGDDHLNGGRGDDILMGGKGADVFEFNPNSGSDIIAAFDSNAVTKSDAGHSVTGLSADFDLIFDHVLLTGFETVTAANVMDFVSQGDSGAVFNAEGTEITFYDIDEAEITADHFEFI